MNRVTITGCGWLGLPLGKFLISKGYLVKGTTTTSDKKQLLESQGIEVYKLDIKNPDDEIIKNLAISDVLIINIPPFNDFTKYLREFLKYFNNKTRIIFISSTSVYNGYSGLVDETFKLVSNEGNGKILADTEKYLTDEFENSVILRCGGLVGPDRYPGRFFAGKINIPGGNEHINLVHLEDCINVINEVIKQPEIKGIYNLCSPDHPLKKEFYTKAAEVAGMNLPQFYDSISNDKIVDVKKLVNDLNYKFIYKSPFDMIKRKPD